MLIDTHAHVNFKAFNADYADVLNRAMKENIWTINVGSQMETSEQAVKIANEFKEGVYALVGFHPLHVMNHMDEEKPENFDPKRLEELLQDKKTVGIGETGLDFFRLPKDRENEIMKMQKQVFAQHLELAKQYDYPVTVHCRDERDEAIAYREILEVLDDYKDVKAVIHCFSEDWEIAEKYLKAGLMISFTGICTFRKKAEAVQDVAKRIPLDRLMLETDCPYLSPEPVRGKTNEPVYVEYVAKKVAELKGITFEEVAEQTTKNAKEFFK
ncbi:TatD family hydrolase, partial [Patescibacteria group bacterium]|nr:TatD family hydrolase [Patescibacteria group bacterium]